MNGNKPGTKYDAGKPILGAVPPNAEIAVGRVLAFGAATYARDNWRVLEDAQTRYMDAALRHLNAVRRGESQDSESGEHHLAHAACCVLFMLELALEEQDNNKEEFEPFVSVEDVPINRGDLVLQISAGSLGEKPYATLINQSDMRRLLEWGKACFMVGK